jgi:hypothetical protein
VWRRCSRPARRPPLRPHGAQAAGDRRQRGAWRWGSRPWCPSRAPWPAPTSSSG